MIMNKSDDTVLNILLFVAVMIVIPVGIFLHAVTLSYLWEWFVVSQFGLPSIGLAAAFGLAFTIRFFAHGNRYFRKGVDGLKNEKENTAKELLKEISMMLFTNPFALGIGYIITLFM